MQIDVVALLESIQQEFHQGVMVEDPPDRFRTTVRPPEVTQAEQHLSATSRISQVKRVEGDQVLQ